MASVTVALSIALLVGWTLIILRNWQLAQVTDNVWLLVSGILSFVVIATVLVLFVVFLAREITEVRRQDSFVDSVTHELKSPWRRSTSAYRRSSAASLLRTKSENSLR